MVSFARALPRLRRQVAEELSGSEPTREQVLACSFRLLDIGLFRIGGEEYADHGGGLGLTTIRKRHVSIESGSAVFDYPSKSRMRHMHSVDDPACVELIAKLRRRRSGPDQLLAYRGGHAWVPVHADDVNEYLKERLGEEFSAKDFRTWNATVVGAAALAANDADSSTKTARRSARSSRPSVPWLKCSATRPPSPEARTSTRGSSTGTCRAGRSARRSRTPPTSTPRATGGGVAWSLRRRPARRRSRLVRGDSDRRLTRPERRDILRGGDEARLRPRLLALMASTAGPVWGSRALANRR